MNVEREAGSCLKLSRMLTHIMATSHQRNPTVMGLWRPMRSAKVAGIKEPMGNLKFTLVPLRISRCANGQDGWRRFW